MVSFVSAAVVAVWSLTTFSVVKNHCEAWAPPRAFGKQEWRSSNNKHVMLQSTATPSSRNRSGRPPSRVSDPDGPTPNPIEEEMEEVDPEDVDGLRQVLSQDEFPVENPHQPWRRGDMAGCNDPINAEWRQRAEKLIYTAVSVVGGEVLDITWFLTTLLVTIDPNKVDHPYDFLKTSGPVIEEVDSFYPQYYDPETPEPEELVDPDPNEVMYLRQTDEERQEEQAREDGRWARKDDDDDPNEPHNPMDVVASKTGVFMNEEGREEVESYNQDEREEAYRERPKVMSLGQQKKELETPLNRQAVSTIAGAILDVLEEVEDELQILSRHELILDGPAGTDYHESQPTNAYLVTQKQFNKHRGELVWVQTVDPWKSNRRLDGHLVDRNSMDVIINQEGRMVTIPLNFVEAVIVPAIAKEEHEEHMRKRDEWWNSLSDAEKAAWERRVEWEKQAILKRQKRKKSKKSP